MAGFGIFRTYQKASMVALAILAMLAFFVLPPLLQYGGQAASLADTPVATWNGGEVREKGLDRAVMMKFVVNRFLQEAAMAAGRDPAQATRFDVDERSVVTMMLLAEEAKKNGIVVSDAAINDFLAKETNGQVGADQFEQIMGGLRAGGGGVSQHDLFEAMRQELLAQNMLLLLQRGLFGNPPGLRWDYFRRLTQSATAEVVPVDVRSVSAKVDLPSAAVLKAFFEKHKEDLPDPRSEKPGFREPHRTQVEYLVAKRGAFVDEISKQITAAEIAEYYEKNKTTQFRARPGDTLPADPAVDAGAASGGQSEGEAPAAEPQAPATEPQAPAEPAPPATEAPAAVEPATPPAAEPAAPPATEPATEPPAEPAEGSGAALPRSPFRQVAFQAPDAPAADAPPADAPAPDALAPQEPAVVGEGAAAEASQPPAAPAAEAPSDAPADAVTPAADGAPVAADEA
ncbi:MAG: SurA N-terminal domain-containing protein [Planctomycetota bacterium]|nr:SurA N-terminal domain-containing protein [Planctomycetota bacterium]